MKAGGCWEPFRLDNLGNPSIDAGCGTQELETVAITLHLREGFSGWSGLDQQYVGECLCFQSSYVVAAIERKG